jgi:glycosyltransferase involved in cell wall biosynthesis
MEILHVYKDYAPVVGGIENHVRLLAEAQAAAGHRVTVLVTSPTRYTTVTQLGGVRVIKAARLAHVASTPLSLRLPALLARERPDITHLHFPYPVGEVSHWLFGRGRRTIITYHSDVVKQQSILRFYRPIMQRVLNRADRILVSSPRYLETSPVLQALASRCEVVPYGINRQAFLSSLPDETAQVRARYPGQRLLLFVGVLRYYKGLQHLLQAMSRINATLLIIGEGPMRPDLQTQARELALGQRVRFLGRLADEALPAYYRAADLFVLPASERSEAFGLVQVEAMSSGTPVVCTELGTGTSYVNLDHVSGLVVPPRDPTALAEAINLLLGDEPLRQRLAQGALARSTLFDMGRMLSDIQRIYHEILAARR